MRLWPNEASKRTGSYGVVAYRTSDQQGSATTPVPGRCLLGHRTYITNVGLSLQPFSHLINCATLLERPELHPDSDVVIVLGDSGNSKG
jgi:hypothetical protein